MAATTTTAAPTTTTVAPSPTATTGDIAEASGAETDVPENPPATANPEDPPGLPADTEGLLVELLHQLATLAAEWNPSGRASVAVVTADGTPYGVNGDRPHISASAVKPMWAAAAIDLAGLDAVVPLAHDALVQSDNFAAGEIIDLIGIDSLNTWSTDIAGLTGTHLAAWYFGTDRVSQSVIDSGSRANFATAADLALFYARLRRGELIDPDGVAALEAWLRDTPRGSTSPYAVDGALLARLPTEVATEAVHKTGWLPPYCCVAEVRLVIDAGIIPLPDDGWFAVAAVSDRGEAYNLSVQWIALTACRVFVLLANDGAHNCERSGDGVPRPELWQPPPEPEEEPESEEESDPGKEPDSGDGTEANVPEGASDGEESESEAEDVVEGENVPEPDGEAPTADTEQQEPDTRDGNATETTPAGEGGPPPTDRDSGGG